MPRQNQLQDAGEGLSARPMLGDISMAVPKRRTLRGFAAKKADVPLMRLVQSITAGEVLGDTQLVQRILDPNIKPQQYHWPRKLTMMGPLPRDPATVLDTTTMATHDEIEWETRFLSELRGTSDRRGELSLTAPADDSEEYDQQSEEERLRLRRLRKKRQNAAQAAEEDQQSQLVKIQQLFQEEVADLAQQQYRIGTQWQIPNWTAHQAKTMPRNRIQSVRLQPRDDQQAPEMTFTQEQAVGFAAESTLTSILNRLPYVLRQGTLGHLPRISKSGKVSSQADLDHTRGWNSVMVAATLAGVPGHILAKVSARMNSMVSESPHHRYWEPSEGTEPDLTSKDYLMWRAQIRPRHEEKRKRKRSRAENNGVGRDEQSPADNITLGVVKQEE